jgi:hypothetical protein
LGEERELGPQELGAWCTPAGRPFCSALRLQSDPPGRSPATWRMSGVGVKSGVGRPQGSDGVSPPFPGAVAPMSSWGRDAKKPALEPPPCWQGRVVHTNSGQEGRVGLSTVEGSGMRSSGQYAPNPPAGRSGDRQRPPGAPAGPQRAEARNLACCPNPTIEGARQPGTPRPAPGAHRWPRNFAAALRPLRGA